MTVHQEYIYSEFIIAISSTSISIIHVYSVWSFGGAQAACTISSLPLSLPFPVITKLKIHPNEMVKTM